MMIKLRFAWLTLFILCVAGSLWDNAARKGWAAPATAPCTYQAAFVADVTIPDDTEVGPGTTLVKTWRLRNAGSCAWGQNDTLKTITFVDGDNLNAEGAGAFPGETPPGALTDVSVTLHAPTKPGVYTSRWKLLVVDAAGRQQAIGVGRTGQPFYARIKVSAALPPATTPSRIEFGAGGTFGRIEDNLLGGELRTYVIKALQDQIMLVNLTPADPDFVVRVKGQNGVVPPSLNPLNATWVGRLPSTQDYLIQLQANTKATHYRLTLTIPERIQFKPGATTATLAGVTNGSHFYSLRAQQGQLMSVTFTAPRPLGFTLYGLEDGAVLHRQAEGGAGWSGQLPATEEYLIQVDQGRSGPTNYTMQVTIPPITDGPPACVDKITFIADVTVPDNTHFAPGATFTKVWRVRNDGDCAWGPSEAIHGIGFVDGARLGVRDVAPLRNYTPPGFTADVGIEMVAPNEPGVYVSNWKFLNGNGDLLGVGGQGNRPLYVKIIVDALSNASGATPQTPATAQPVNTLPATCVPTTAALLTYVEPERRYCLLYPQTFRLSDAAPGRISIDGPPLDQSIEPVFAALAILVEGPANGRALAQVVDEATSEYKNVGPLTRSSMQLGGEAAEVIDGIPGRTGSRQVFVVHHDTIYHLALYPVDENFPQAAPDVQKIWQAVTTSFTFLGTEN